MFEVKHLKGNTYYYEAFTNVGIYVTKEGKAILIDSCDHKRMVRGLDRQLTEMGLTVDTVINTHSHPDHICGNAFFKEKYGCRILSSAKEQPFIRFVGLDVDFHYAGIDINKSVNPFYAPESTDAEVITEENLPRGIEVISLPGHNYEMLGVRTDDGVLFLADSILSKKTWETHALPYFYNINQTIDTLKEVREMKGEIYVPSHDEPTNEIRNLADYNIERLSEIKERILALCENRTFEEIFYTYTEKMQIKFTPDKYPFNSAMVRNFLQALIEDKVLGTRVENGRLVYFKK